MTQDQIYALAMDPVNRFNQQISSGFERRRDDARRDEGWARQDALIADERSYQDAVRRGDREEAARIRAEINTRQDAIIAGDRAHQGTIRAEDRTNTLEDRTDDRAYKATQDQASFDRAIRLYLIEQGVLDPGRANDPAAVAAAAAELTPEKKRALQERMNLLREFSELGRLVAQPDLGIAETIPIEEPEAMDLAELRETVNRMRMQAGRIAEGERAREDRQDVAATHASINLDEAEGRLQLTMQDMARIEQTVAAGRNPLTMSKQERSDFDAAVQEGIEAERTTRLFQYQQAAQQAQRTRGTPYFDETGRAALPGSLREPPAETPGAGDGDPGGDTSFFDTISPRPQAGAAGPGVVDRMIDGAVMGGTMLPGVGAIPGALLNAVFGGGGAPAPVPVAPPAMAPPPVTAAPAPLAYAGGPPSPVRGAFDPLLQQMERERLAREQAILAGPR